MKKIISILIILIGVFTLIGCNELVDNENDNTKDPNIPTEIVDDLDETKETVTNPDDPIEEIVNEHESSFYDLQGAFDEGLLNNDDLLEIKYYLNDPSKPIYPKPLNTKLTSFIKEARHSDLRNLKDVNDNIVYSGLSILDLEIAGYYGVYNNSYAVLIYDSMTQYLDAEGSEIVDGVEFNYNDSNRILIFHYEQPSGPEVPYSLIRGLNWQLKNPRLDEFDIWNITYGDDNRGMVFFYARSKEELLSEIEKHKDQPVLYNPLLENNIVNALINSYDDEYFKDNILLFYYKFEPNLSENFVYSVEVIDNKLFLNVNRFESVLTAISSYRYTITISKDDAQDVEDFNVAVRTITTPIDRLSIPIKSSVYRNIYLNGLDVEDFNGLSNLREVRVYTSSLNVDIKFNTTLTEEELANILVKLEAMDTIVSIGYKSKEWIRVQVSHQFYDKITSKTLKLKEILGDEIPGSEKFTIEILNFIPIVIVTLIFEKSGKSYHQAMKEELVRLNLSFINYSEFKV